MVQSNAPYRPKTARTGNTTVPVPAATSLSTPEQSLLKFLSAHNHSTLSSSTFKSSLQQVKSKLYDKDYEAAFSNEEYRRAYQARWVPSRAIIYRRLLRESADHIKQALFGSSDLKQEPQQQRHAATSTDDQSDRSLALTSQVIMIGGGAGSELCALASMLERLPTEAWNDPPSTSPDSANNDDPSSSTVSARRQVAITILDSADWSTILESQRTGLLSAFPSLQNRLNLTFSCADVLNLSPSTLSSLPLSSTRLTTILFTIHELFLQSRTKTLSFLSTLSTTVPKGSLLLIVESASLSTIPIGTAGREYPLGMLLDTALTQDKKTQIAASTPATASPTPRSSGSNSAPADSSNRSGSADSTITTTTNSVDRAKWECLRAEDEGQWYRLPQDSSDLYGAGTGANVKLENSRVVIRLYRRL